MMSKCFARWGAYEPSREELVQPAIVFTPHPDDETLACGGIMARKIHMGAKILVVAMTDGRHSHSNLMDEMRLKEIRAGELRNSVQSLGGSPQWVEFLEFEDNRLAEQHHEATRQIRAIISREEPQQVFVPYRYDPPADHRATYQAVIAALIEEDFPAEVWEYPVWAWYQWPWVSRPGRICRRMYLKQTLKGVFGLRMSRAFNRRIDITEVKTDKQKALDCFRSQMTPLSEQGRWLTLGDIANGAFLRCFMRDYEVFKVTKHPRRNQP